MLPLKCLPTGKTTSESLCLATFLMCKSGSLNCHLSFLSQTLFCETIHSSISVSFHVNNQVQNFELLTGDTVWKCELLLPYLYNYLILLLSLTTGSLFVMASVTFAYWHGQTTCYTSQFFSIIPHTYFRRNRIQGRNSGKPNENTVFLPKTVLQHD